MEEDQEITKEDESAEMEETAPEATPEGDQTASEAIGKLTQDGNVSKSSVELVKNIAEILEKGRVTSLNITINDIKGDHYADQAANNSAGHDNLYQDAVHIAPGSSERDERKKKRT